MAFYARYVPPAILTPSIELKLGLKDEVSSSKKRKRDSRGNTTVHIDKSAENEVQNKTLVQDKNVVKRLDFEIKNEAGIGTIFTEKKKRKRDRKPSSEQETQTAKSESGTCIVNNDDAPKKTKEKKGRKELLKEASPVFHGTVTADQEITNATDSAKEDGVKHRKIRAKFEKSSKSSAKLLKKSQESYESQDALEKPLDAPALQTHGLVPLPQPLEKPDDPASSRISMLPDWLARPIVVSSKNRTPFKELPIDQSIRDSLQSNGINQAFAIQTGVLPMLLPGNQPGDLCISAATGSGKTLAYVLPMVVSLRGRPLTRLRGLIVVPTRELVTQVRDTLQMCTGGTGLKIGTAVGSKTMKQEQELLVKKEQRYDPENYKIAQRNQLLGEKDLMDWNDDFATIEDQSKCLVDFVVDYSSSIDILICTPGRLVDHMRTTKGFTLEHVQWLVIDEADRLLDESFQQWIDIVLPALQMQPRRSALVKGVHELFHIYETRDVRKIVLSATMTKDISKLMALQLKRPRLVILDTSYSDLNTENYPISSGSRVLMHQSDFDLPATLRERAIPIKQVEEKPLYLLELLLAAQSQQSGFITDRQNKTKVWQVESELSIPSSSDSETSSNSSGSDSAPSSSSSSAVGLELDDRTSSMKLTSSSTYGVLVFTNNNESALRLARLLVLLRPSLAVQIGSLTKSTATSTGRRTLTAFRKRKLSILIASDRASRGLDLQDLAHVVNYDMPSSLTSYIHRVGRTARAGKTGLATTLVAHHQARWFWNEIARSTKVRRSWKVNKVENGINLITEADRQAYAMALRTLGQEARVGVV